MKVAVLDCKERITIKTFIKGLILDTNLHADLILETHKTFVRVRIKVKRVMMYEEDLPQRKGPIIGKKGAGQVMLERKLAV